MAANQVTLMGLEAALVLRDERGEFEVRSPFVADSSGLTAPVLNLERVAEAIGKRQAEAPVNRRPRY